MTREEVERSIGSVVMFRLCSGGYGYTSKCRPHWIPAVIRGVKAKRATVTFATAKGNRLTRQVAFTSLKQGEVECKPQ